MSGRRRQTFGMPAAGYAIFSRDEGEGYAFRRGRLNVRVVGEVDGSVFGTVSLSKHPSSQVFAVTFSAGSFTAFQRLFQAMVALGHDGSAEERHQDWDEDAFWLASVPWSIDTATPC